MKIAKFFLPASAFLISIAVQAQTADDIIAKHIEAIGGKDKLSQVNSVHMEMTSQAMGNDMTSNVDVLNGKGFKSETDFGGQKIIQSVTDKSGWSVNPYAGQSGPTPMSVGDYKLYKIQADMNPLLDYAAKRSRVELLGTEKLDSVNAYKLKLTTSDSVEVTYYIDPNTYYLVRIVMNGEMQGQAVLITSTLSNYRKTDFGIVLPFSTETNLGDQFTYTSTVTKVVINSPVDPAIFDMPKQ